VTSDQPSGRPSSGTSAWVPQYEHVRIVTSASLRPT
jgi:hypothetical protein